MPRIDRSQAREHSQALDWLNALQYALDASTSDHWREGVDHPELRIINVSRSGCDLEVEMRFRTGKTYCCAEPCCHFASYDAAFWRTFRHYLAEVSDRQPPRFIVRVIAVVESRANLTVLECIGLPVASAPYTFTTDPDREPLPE